MKKRALFILAFIFVFSSSPIFAQKQKSNDKSNINHRIDNMGYWMKLAKEGKVPYNPVVKMGGTKYKGTAVNSKAVNTEDSPDIAVNTENTNTQSENSIYVDPNDNLTVLNSNNSTDWNGSSVNSLYGTSGYYTFDGAVSPWEGSYEGTGGSNSGDPAAAIDLDGRMFVGNIKNSSMQQGVAYSLDNGVTWTNVTVGSSSDLDKNHLWVDNSVTSPYSGYIYSAWTDFGLTDSQVEIVQSTDHGLTWSSPQIISNSPFDHGVNIQTDAEGNVYVIWAEYNNWPNPEDAIGMSKSTDGGATWSTPVEIITGLKGTRNNDPLAHRTNSFPVMTIDQNNGNMYVVWSNYGLPGTNTGNWVNAYMIKSTDNGANWTAPIQVSQSPNTDGTFSYLPWITCDPVTGHLGVIFLDNRNVSGNDVEAWVSVSTDEGDTWEDFRVSDVSWTTKAIPGLASGYMGDYLGITANNSLFYPIWSDDRDGVFRAYTSPFETNNRAKPTDLDIVLTEATGQTDLSWSYSETKTLQHFVVYRDNVQIGTSTETSYTDMLPTYGVYNYSVTAMHDDGESSPVKGNIQWGNPNVSVSPTSLTETLLTNQASVRVLTIENTGELDLTYNIATAITSKGKGAKVYCDASGGGDEYISGVLFGTINNTGTSADGYVDYTAMSTDVDAGNTYTLTVTNGNAWSSDDWGVWFDWNQDGDFEDAGENAVCVSSEGSDQVTWDITVPSDALGGQTTMRIRLKYSGSDCGSPCGSTSYGEVEDYTVNVNSWLQVENMTGTVTPGSTEYINVNFNSTDLALGDYTADITVNSNDTDEPAVVVPVTLHVVDNLTLHSNASADDYLVCNGSSTTLHANAVGGSGTYTYSWTSLPAGFTSTDSDPVVSPSENTVYTVSIDDGVDIVTSDVSINLSDVPAQANIPAGDTEFCQDGANTIYSTSNVSGADSYIWVLDPVNAGSISGNTTSGNVDWASNFNGLATVSVSAVNSCGTGAASGGLTITVNELPDVLFDALNDVCINDASFTLSGGSPAGGTYSGDGVTSGNFDPAVAGAGNHTIVYTYSNGTCENSAFQTIIVNDLPNVTLSPFDNVAVNEAAFTLSGGSPAGGTYSGDGVSNGMFDPSVAGEGSHVIFYTYSDGNSCENSAEQTIFVEESNAVSSINSDEYFDIYPNPNTGLFTLKIKYQDLYDIHVSVVNQLGMTVYLNRITKLSNSSYQIDLSAYSSGIYFINISGKLVNVTKKVVIN